MVLVELPPGLGPFCSTENCMQWDCCIPAGLCRDITCPAAYRQKSASNAPPYCEKANCTITECCDLMSPNHLCNVTGARFWDDDLDENYVGGTITWIPPNDNIIPVFWYEIYLGRTKNNKLLVGNVTYGTNSLNLPAGTLYRHPLIVIYSGNSAGPQYDGNWFGLSDAAMTAKNVEFKDYDLDEGEIAGDISWVPPLLGGQGPMIELCRHTMQGNFSVYGTLQGNDTSGLAAETMDFDDPGGIKGTTVSELAARVGLDLSHPVVRRQLYLEYTETDVNEILLAMPGVGWGPVANITEGMVTTTTTLAPDDAIMRERALGLVGLVDETRAGLVQVLAAEAWWVSNPNGNVTTDADGTVTNLTRHYSELLANLSHLRFSEETLRSPYLSDGLPVVESGIGVVAVTTKNGNITTKHWRRFRTDLSIEETNNMVAFLNGLDEGTIVLLSAAGDAWRNIHQSAVDAVEYLGANDFHKIRTNDSYALAGIKGAKRFRAWMPEQLTVRGSGLRAKAHMWCSLLSTGVYLINEELETETLMHEINGTDLDHLAVPAGTALNNASHVAIMLHSALGRRKDISGAKFGIMDAISTISNLQFTADETSPFAEKVKQSKGKEIDMSLLSGTITWTEPENTEIVTAYRVYLLENETSSTRYPLYMNLDVGDASCRLPMDNKPVSNFTTIQVSAVSKFGEQSKPAMTTISLSDLASSLLMGSVIGAVAATQASRVAGSVAQSAKGMEKMGGANADKGLEHCPVKGEYINADGLYVKIEPAGELPGWRNFLAPLVPGLVSFNTPKVTVLVSTVQETSGIIYAVKSNLPCWKKPEVKMKMNKVCRNTWDADGIVIRKLANRHLEVAVKQEGQEGPAMMVKVDRRMPFFYKCFEKPYVRAALKAYAPLITMMIVSVFVAGSAALMVGVALVCISIVAIGLVFVASRTSVIKDVCMAIQAAPPLKIRKKFWKNIALLVGILPAAPAFLAQTTTGYLTGGVSVMGAVLTNMGAHGFAALLQMGFAAAVQIIQFLSMGGGGEAEEMSQTDSAKWTATFMSAAMMGIKGLDNFLSAQETLFMEVELPQDKVLAAAREMQVATGVSLDSAFVLQTFKERTLEARSLKRVAEPVREMCLGVVKEGRKAVEVVVKNLHTEKSEVTQYPPTLALALGAAIDAAGDDVLTPMERAQLAGMDDLAGEGGMEFGLEMEIAQMRIHDRLEVLQAAIKEVVEGPLQARKIAKIIIVAKRGREAVKALKTLLGPLETALGIDCPKARLRAAAEIFALHVAYTAEMADHAKNELQAGDVSAVDLKLLSTRIQEMDQHMKTAQPLVDGSAGRGPASKLSKRILETLANLNREVSSQPVLTLLPGEVPGWKAHKRWRGPPTAEELAKFSDGLREVVTFGESVSSFLQLVRQHAPYTGDLEEEAKEQMRETVKKAKSKRQEEETEAVEGLWQGRVCVGVMDTIADELQAMNERAMDALASLETLAPKGNAILAEIKELRQKETLNQCEEFPQLQEAALDFLCGAPVTALIQLQEMGQPCARKALQMLTREMDRLDDLLQCDGELLQVDPLAGEAQKAVASNQLARYYLINWQSRMGTTTSTMSSTNSVASQKSTGGWFGRSKSTISAAPGGKGKLQRKTTTMMPIYSEGWLQSEASMLQDSSPKQRGMVNTWGSSEASQGSPPRQQISPGAPPPEGGRSPPGAPPPEG